MKTKQELDDLKANWKADPCWDIEDTEGFEEHREELLVWRKEYDKKLDDEESARLREKAMLLLCSVQVVRQIELLEYRIAKLER